MLMNGLGDFTIAEEMATMRPNRRCCMPSMTRCTNSSGDTIVRCKVSAHSAASMSANAVGGGPSPLSSTMSGSGHAASSASCTSGVVESPTTGVAVTP